MAKFACLLPRGEMVAMAQRLGREMNMELVVCKLVSTNQLAEEAEAARRLGADILVARGRQASVLKRVTDLPLVEIKLTGQEVALLLSRAKRMVSHIPRPKIGVVTLPNMIGDIHHFDEVLNIELHTYFIAGADEMGVAAQQAIDDEMDVVLGGDFVNEYCREQGVRALFWESTEDSIRAALRNARSMGFASDAQKKNTAHLQTLLDYSFNGILELDAHGVITRANDMACKILDLHHGALMGQPLAAFMQAEDVERWDKTLSSGKELYFSLLEVAGVNVVANAAPVMAGTESEGIIFSFYELKKMARQGEHALRERYRLRRYLAQGRFETVSRTSREMQQTVKLARTFAETEQPILLQGEVGSGKSLFAQSIHNSSPCAKGPFVTFNPDARGSRNDALAAAGKAADGGTLHIEGVERLSRAEQDLLRHIIESGVVYCGEEAPLPVQVRVIASMAGSLAEQAASGAFQGALYYLLAPMCLILPPLRTRPEDLDRAIDMCLDDCVARLDRYVVLTAEARRVLMGYPWPGNYTQLHAFLERLALTTPSRTVNDSYVRQLLWEIYPAARPAPPDADAAPTLPPEAAALAATLSRCGGNREVAAAELGISKTTLWRRIKKYGIRGHFQ